MNHHHKMAKVDSIRQPMMTPSVSQPTSSNYQSNGSGTMKNKESSTSNSKLGLKPLRTMEMDSQNRLSLHV